MVHKQRLKEQLNRETSEKFLIEDNKDGLYCYFKTKMIWKKEWEKFGLNLLDLIEQVKDLLNNEE